MSTVTSRKKMFPKWEAEAKILLSENKSKKEIKEALRASGANLREIEKITKGLTQSMINKMGKVAFPKLKEGANEQEIRQLLMQDESNVVGLIDDGIEKGKKLLLSDIRKQARQMVKDKLANEDISQQIASHLISREKLEKMLIDIRLHINTPLKRQMWGSLFGGIALFVLAGILIIVMINTTDEDDTPNSLIAKIMMGSIIFGVSSFISSYSAKEGMRK